VAGLERLGKAYLVDRIVLDLVSYRAPHRSHGLSADGHGNDDDAYSPDCEPLVVAAGAHLHWHLAGGSKLSRYRRERVEGRPPPPGAPLSLPPEYVGKRAKHSKLYSSCWVLRPHPKVTSHCARAFRAFR